MICIVLSSPSPSGFQPAYGFTTASSTQLLPSNTQCLPGYITSVGAIDSQFDGSGAMGNVSQGLSWSFEIADHDGTDRRSIGLLDGSERFVGWDVQYWRDVPGGWSLVDLGELRISNVSAGGTTVSFEAISSWVLSTQTVGLGAEGQKVGIVVGGHDVTVQTLELADPKKIEYRSRVEGLLSGRPGECINIGVPGYAPSARQTFGTGYKYVFQLPTSEEAFAFYQTLLGHIQRDNLFVSGAEYSTKCLDVVMSGSYSVTIYVDRFFHAVEIDHSRVFVYSRSQSFTAVVGAASRVTSWVSDAGDVSPKGDEKVENYVISFAPSVVSPDGFIASTLIPTEIAFQDGEWTRVGLSDCLYYGGTGNIPTNGMLSSVDGIDAVTLAPISGTSSFGIWAELVATGGIQTVTFGFRVIPTEQDTSTKYSRVHCDLSYQFAIRNNTVGTTSINFGYPLNSGPNENSGNMNPGTTQNIGIAMNGGVENNEYQIFDSIDDANAQGQFIASFPFAFAGSFNVYFQTRGIAFYGVSTLAFGSSYAVVTPGDSPWWTGQVHPQVAARLLLQAVSGFASLSVPSYVPLTAECGDYIAPETSHVEAAVELASRYWLYLCPGGQVGADGTAEGELVTAPTIVLSNDSDIATEITIQYDEWAGEFRRTAYIANVHEVFDEANPDRYYGGWGMDGEDFGRTIWNACRNAWKMHGIRKSKVMELPGVHAPEVVGKMWTATRGGAMRCEWLAYQSAFVTFEVSETAPGWWAGSTVYIPQTMASLQGYDLTAFASFPLLVTSKTHDPLTQTSRYEVNLPPITSTGTTDRIVQTLDAGDDRIVQTLNPADDRIVQILET